MAKDKQKAPEESKNPSTEPKKADEVVLKQDDFQFLVDSVKNLTQQVKELKDKGNGIIDLEYVDKHYAFVRFYDGKMVRSHTKCWNALDPEEPESKRKIPWIGAIVDGLEKPVEMTLTQFMEELPKKKVEIVERIVVDKGERVVGSTPVIKYDYSNYRAIDTGVRVAQKVVTPVYELKVKFEDGHEDQLPEEGVIGQ